MSGTNTKVEGLNVVKGPVLAEPDDAPRTEGCLFSEDAEPAGDTQPGSASQDESASRTVISDRAMGLKLSLVQSTVAAGHDLEDRDDVDYGLNELCTPASSPRSPSAPARTVSLIFT